MFNHDSHPATQGVTDMTHESRSLSSIQSAGRVQSDESWITLAELGKLLRISLASPQTEDERFLRRRVKAGHPLFTEGEHMDSIYVVYTGFLKTLLTDSDGNEQVLGFPMRGDLLGVDGLYKGAYVSRVVALSDADVVVIPWRRLTTLSRNHPELENLTYSVLSRELVNDHLLLGVLGTLGAEARVARFLARLSDRYREMGFSPRRFLLRMSRQEIGSYLGLTLETVSRSFSALHASQYIRVDQREIEILDLEGLRHLQRLPQLRRGKAAAAKAAGTFAYA